ncbi:molybdopterin-dependent oxidoreductase [Myceligenerans xiligouense]|uniref:DMSO/TMAO reductase YedYZ molybdopterin-dependent catalytic subunit n=1 Tax=Myceligenerans xiligouense TaxID=253184 RepID=A0A3N4YS26_9MICO|nr:molybdopterin-dependent oxidoreductase [Myceligenerans xiligouense]RPF22184.1 DMSO/TMAO reductase YedYZ molybdopterin-dependent catalytic subunit [Myceligenerans xiligouense]
MNSGDRHGALAAVAGVVAAGVGLAVSELLSAVIAPGASTIFAGGAAVVDIVPSWLKDFAVEWFGTADKAVLLGSMGFVLAVGAALAGWLERRRSGIGVALLVLVGLAGAVLAATRPAATPLWAAPSLIGIGVAVPVLRAAVRTLGTGGVTRPAPRAVPGAGEAVPDRRADGESPDAARPGPDTAPDLTVPAAAQDATSSAAPQDAAPPAAPPSGPDRRRFLQITGLAAAGALVALAASQAIGAGGRAVEAVRERFRLPDAARPADPVPSGADLPVDGLAPYVTPNDDFYRIDTALRVPEVDPENWSLRVTGMVEEPFEIGWDELVALPMTEHHVTLACVSNAVGGDLIGNALWLGYPIRELLERARPQAGADMVLSRSVDGFTAGTPLEVLTDPDRMSLLAIGMNGEPLPTRHGFPARLVVPGLYGYVSATKWVTELKVTTFDQDEGYWTPRGWSALGPIKVQSRVDVPRGFANVDAGEVVVAGVAWAQHVGIQGVEVKADDGDWIPAELAESTGVDTWRQWRAVLDLEAGDHTVSVRATNTDGETQTDAKAPPAPDGATGHHTVAFTVV